MLFLKLKVISTEHMLNKCYNSLRSPIVIRGPVHFYFELRLRQTRCSCVVFLFEHWTITTCAVIHQSHFTDSVLLILLFHSPKFKQSILFKKLLPLSNCVNVLFVFFFLSTFKDFENIELLPVNTDCFVCLFFFFTLCACAFGLHTMNVDMVPHQQSVWILQISTCSRPPEQ